MQLVISINIVLCSTRGLVIIAEEQRYEINGLRPGLAVVLFMPMREASSLRLENLDQSAQQCRDSEIPSR